MFLFCRAFTDIAYIDEHSVSALNQLGHRHAELTISCSKTSNSLLDCSHQLQSGRQFLQITCRQSKYTFKPK